MDMMISNVLCDFPFSSWNQPLKLADNQCIRIPKQSNKILGCLRRTSKNPQRLDPVIWIRRVSREASSYTWVDVNAVGQQCYVSCVYDTIL